jgi:uncharacterized protein (DUF4415 family)
MKTDNTTHHDTTAANQTPTHTQQLITQVCDEIKSMLLEKNRKYGNSALDPIRIFSKADAKEQIRVRIDDKLSRLRNVQNDETEDVISDLIGYLVLLKVSERVEQEPAPEIEPRCIYSGLNHVGDIS